ncbi:MAG: hypothetical protein ACKVQW_06005 [Pyrinomonadaceae bacterium]
MNQPINEVTVNLTSSRVKMAFAQLESPLPNGKVIGVLPSGRETYVWSNKDQIELRLAKAMKIIEFLHDQHPGTEVLVFPEYSLPIVQESVSSVLQDYSNKYNLIIVGGADNIPDETWEKVYNKCPVFLPNNHEPVWIVKKNLSKWENRYIDEFLEPAHQNPVLSWSVGGKKHYISIHICLDFAYVMRSQLFDTNAPVIRIVPMCSPDMDLLKGYADLTLTEDGERSVVLCNCIGKGSIGKSGIFLVSPSGEKLKASYEYEDDLEGLVCFEVDCSRLIQPKRSTAHTRDALENIHQHKIFTTPDGIEIHPFIPRQSAKTSKAIINPAIFQHLDKTMRIAFIGVEAYGTFNKEEISKPGFECYSVLGHSDVMITHLHQKAGAMLFDITHTIPGFQSGTTVGFDPGGTNFTAETSRFPFFEVTVFHKVLGQKLTKESRHAFDGKSLTAEELNNLLAISKNWEIDSVTQKMKEEFLQEGWILGKTNEEPGDIDAVITIYVNDPENVDRALRDFENRVIPQLIEKHFITSLYEGTGSRMSIHYLLRVKCDIKQLFSFISMIHATAAADKFSIKTSTFVIAEKWSPLDLEKNLSSRISPIVDVYLKNEIVPLLDENGVDRLYSIDTELLQNVMEEHRNLKTSFRILEKRVSFSTPGKIQQMTQALTLGLARQEIRLLATVHDHLQGRVEEILRDLTERLVPDDYFEANKSTVNIPGGRAKLKLTYAEYLKLLMQSVKDGLIDQKMLEPLQNLFAKTKDVRNHVKHSDFNELTIEAIIQALNQYCAFLISWDTQESPTPNQEQLF